MEDKLGGWRRAFLKTPIMISKLRLGCNFFIFSKLCTRHQSDSHLKNKLKVFIKVWEFL